MNREKLVRIRAVQVLDDFNVRLEFTDGTQREVDLEIYLRGPIFEPMRNSPALFRAVQVNDRMGTIAWDNGADIDPDVLYYGLKPAWMETEKQQMQIETFHRSHALPTTVCRGSRYEIEF
ncbi:MAG: DUF2442 domain-containing protein [Caldilineaceae bacterium]|nr:DUF2442 domain-containing protein [Caldilineaceae bacterium]